MQSQKPEDKLYRDVYRRVLAGMETGNAGLARSTLTEYRVFDKERAESIREDVLETYGILL